MKKNIARCHDISVEIVEQRLGLRFANYFLIKFQLHSASRFEIEIKTRTYVMYFSSQKEVDLTSNFSIAVKIVIVPSIFYTNIEKLM